MTTNTQHEGEEELVQQDASHAHDDVEEDEELPVLEFARFHKLSTDYTSESPFVYALSNRDKLKQWDFEVNVPDEVCALQPFESLAKEKLVVSSEAAELLQEAISAPDEYPITGVETPQRRCELKQELPLLRSDNEYDVQHFGRRVKPDFRCTNIPREIVNEEHDEGLSWPTRYHALPARFDAEARREKLEVSKEVLLCIQNAIRDPITTEEKEKLMAVELEDKKVSNVANNPT